MIIKFSDFLSLDTGFDYMNSNQPHIFIQEYIILQNIKYRVVSYSELLRNPGIDGKYHAIYIWIDFNSGEYYIGKVNRPKISEIQRYIGSGTKFKGKYKKNKDRYARYYLFVCQTESETEQIEATLVNETIIKDPFCLNLVTGGGGISKAPFSQYRKDQQSQYMKAHPERYAAMLNTVKNFYEKQIKQRNKRIKETLSQEKYRNAMRDRIKKWQTEHPEEYIQARKKNASSIKNPEVQIKRAQSLKYWQETHPEEFALAEANRKAALAKPEAKEKRSKARKEWIRNNPEKFKEQSIKSHETQSKPVAMIDILSGSIIKTFKSARAASDWLIENGITKSANPSSSICAVCNKKSIPGHGIKKSAYGYKWEYINK